MSLSNCWDTKAATFVQHCEKIFYPGCPTDNGQFASGRNEYRYKSRAVDKGQTTEGFRSVSELTLKCKIVLHRQERS